MRALTGAARPPPPQEAKDARPQCPAVTKHWVEASAKKGRQVRRGLAQGWLPEPRPSERRARLPAARPAPQQLHGAGLARPQTRPLALATCAPPTQLMYGDYQLPALTGCHICATNFPRMDDRNVIQEQVPPPPPPPRLWRARPSK